MKAAKHNVIKSLAPSCSLALRSTDAGDSFFKVHTGDDSDKGTQMCVGRMAVKPPRNWTSVRIKRRFVAALVLLSVVENESTTVWPIRSQNSTVGGTQKWEVRRRRTWEPGILLFVVCDTQRYYGDLWNFTSQKGKQDLCKYATSPESSCRVYNLTLLLWRERRIRCRQLPLESEKKNHLGCMPRQTGNYMQRNTFAWPECISNKATCISSWKRRAESICHFESNAPTARAARGARAAVESAETLATVS